MATIEDPLGLVGTTIDDKYIVEAVVGEGGFAVVYRATHKLWQKPVAIKCFKTLMDASPALREKLLKDFVQEGALLTELSARSASIVQARDIGTLTTKDGAWVPFMVLEWLEGKTLDGLIEEGGSNPWTVDLTMAILEPVALGLDLAHRRNIAHRDIKPANIFIVGHLPSYKDDEAPPSGEMHVKLLDFGIAKVVQSAADQGFTKTGGQVTSFTPQYGAPEQFSRARGATGPWTDVYSLALIFSEMTSGKLALEGEDFIQLGMSSADPNRRPTPRTLGAKVNDAVEAVSAKALALKPQDRFQSAGEYWNALREALGHAPMKRTATTPVEMPDGPASRASRHAFEKTEAVPSVRAVGDASTGPGVTAPLPPQKHGNTGVVVGVAAALIAAGVAGVFLMRKPADDGKKLEPATSASASAAPSASESAAPVAAKTKCPAGMAEIPGGKFFMGSDTGEENEKPAHNVTLSPYCMDLHEVTVEDYKKCSDGGDCKRAWAVVDWPDITPKEKKTYTPLCNINDPEGKAKHPVNCIDWQMAVTYCEAQKKRLPSEAEWEFAARGPDGRVYPWGDELPDETHLNACGKECLDWGRKTGEQVKAMYKGDDGFPNTAPVGSFPKGASRYGLVDVVGNVWEWTFDWDGKYTADSLTDPKGPSKGEDRVVRGGAWNGAFASWVRPSFRYSFPPETKSHAVGFRCAKDQQK
ncbi:MAG: SUMF1/EgtB/PvdO family nonheme iron enzyme [Polyangiales bacterium]